MKWHDMKDAACPVARAMGVVGDRWTLLILRECFLNVRRFDGFQTRLGITRHLLAERLKRLEQMQILERKPYQERPVRYEYLLTDKGRAFAPVLLAMQDWAQTHLPSDAPKPFDFLRRSDGEEIVPVLMDGQTGEVLDHTTVQMKARKEA